MWCCDIKMESPKETNIARSIVLLGDEQMAIAIGLEGSGSVAFVHKMQI